MKKIFFTLVIFFGCSMLYCQAGDSSLLNVKQFGTKQSKAVVHDSAFDSTKNKIHVHISHPASSTNKNVVVSKTEDKDKNDGMIAIAFVAIIGIAAIACCMGIVMDLGQMGP